MYLVLFDKFLINGEERSYYICKNEQYDLICRQYPGINELLKEDIDEMLIFAGKAEADKKALTVECESIEIIENSDEFKEIEKLPEEEGMKKFKDFMNEKRFSKNRETKKTDPKD